MRTDEIKVKIVEYLRENGSASISELVREFKCGRQVVYDAVKELQAENKVRTELRRGRRLVILTGVVPRYIKVLTTLTILNVMLVLLFTSAQSDLIQIHLANEYNNGILISSTFPPFVITLSILFGFWLAVFLLKREDLQEVNVYLKRTTGEILKIVKGLVK